MKQKIADYKRNLERGITEYMALPTSEKSAVAVGNMVECWEHVNKMEKALNQKYIFTEKDAETWNKEMINEDGTIGGHWTIEDTSAVARSQGVTFDHISEANWSVTMNMIYSDYYNVAKQHGVDTPEFYADMAKAFLFDKDGGAPNEKLGAYYNCVVM